MARRRPYQHQNPNYDFLSDLGGDRSPLEAPVQEYLASAIQRAYSSGDPNPGDLPFLTSPALRSQLPSVPSNIAEAEALLMKSHYPQMLTIASRMENTNVGMGDLFSEMITPTNPSTPSFRQSVLNWDPNKGSLFNHMTNSLKNAASSALKGYTSLGMSVDAGNPSTGFGGIVNGPDPDRQLAENDFSGAPAAYSMPAKQPWYQQVAQQARGKTIPTPFYAPEGQGAFVQDANGRTVLNPQLSTNPKVGPQVSVTGEDLAGYSNTLDDFYSMPKDQRVIDFGREKQVKSVNKFLRGVNNQLQGMEHISTDAEVMGASSLGEGDWLRTYRSGPSVSKDGTVIDDKVYVDADPVEYNGPVKTIGSATRQTLDSFASPTENLMKSAAEEVTIQGRLGRNKIQRWKEEVTAKELRIEKAAGYYGFEWENPQMAKNQTLAWRNAKGALGVHAQSLEAAIDYVDNDPSIPAEYKQQAVDNIMEIPEAASTRQFGSYGSQAQPSLEEAAVPEPEVPMDPSWSTEKPATVSDVRNLSKPAAPATVQQAAQPAAPAVAETVVGQQAPVVANQAKQVYDRAVSARRTIEQEFPDFVRDHLGRGKENMKAFDAWRQGLGERRELFENLWSDLHGERPQAQKMNAQSVWSQMVSENGGWKGEPASSSAAATPPAAAARPSSSKGQTAVKSQPSAPVGVSTRTPDPNPVEYDNEGFQRSVPQSPKPTNPMFGSVSGAGNSGGGNGNKPPTTTAAPAQPEEPRGPRVSGQSSRGDEPTSDDLQWLNEQDAAATPARSRGGFESTPLRVTGEWSQEQINRQIEGMGEERRALSEKAARNLPLSNREARLTTEAAYKNMMGVGVENVYREGSVHGTYGVYKQTDLDDASKGGDFWDPEERRSTMRNSTIQKGKEVYQSALSQAFEAGGFDGLSSRELASTVHKRVQEGISKIVKDYVAEWDEKSPEASAQNKATGQQVKDAAGAFLNAGDAKLREAAETSKIGDVNRGALPATGKKLNDFYGKQGMEEFTERVDELGGPTAVASGPRRVLMAGGHSFDTGADDPFGGSGGGGGQRGKGIKSIYSEPLGHFMMAQFMASMAWKSTGGSVMESANQWADNQYGYLGIEQFGGGEASAATMSRSRKELASSFAGNLAYQQYGMFSEMGYVASNLPGGDNILRGVNDLKMGLGAAAVSGVGTWGIGALAAGASPALGAALTGAAAPVALAAGIGVGIPSLGMTAMNMATGQDSYEGYSWKNVLGGSIMQLGSLGAERNDLGLKGNLVSKVFDNILWGASGSQQERFSETVFGQSRRDLVANSWIGEKIGIANVNWLYEGSDEKSQQVRDLSKSVMMDTGLTEDVTIKGLSGLQAAFGGLDTKERQDAAKLVMQKASDNGVDVSAILSGAGSLAGQRGVYEGTNEFMELTTDFANMSPLEQQKELARSSRNYQKYAQWIPYLEGGTAEGYSLFNKLGGDVNMAQTQSIQQVLAQAQQMGVDLTPGMATSLASTVNSMKPWQAMDVTRMASSLTEMGAGSFTSTFSDITSALKAENFSFDGSNIVSGVGNNTDTLNFIKGVTSGNQYALADYGRMAGIGVLQMVDQQGLQTGLKDMSGLLAYAQQDILRNPSLTGSQTLSGLGMSFAHTDGSALLDGGIWGYQQAFTNQTNALQGQQMGLQFQQLASNRSFMYQSWGIENQINTQQWQSTIAGFDFQNLMMDTQREHRLQDAALQRGQRDLSNTSNAWMRDFDYQTSLMRRDWAREDYQFNTQMRQMNFGWQMEDMDEQIRRSSGYERAMLIKQRDRATLSENLQSGQAEKGFERQEELWAREDERYGKGVEFNEKMIELDLTRFELNQRQAEEMYNLNKGRLAEEQDSATKLHELRMEMEQLQRERQEEQLRHSEQSLNIQKQMMELQNEYSANMTIISHTQTEMEASLRKITSYSPAFSRMLGDFLDFLENASQLPPPGYGGTVTYK